MVVDEAGEVAAHGGVDDGVVIDAEEVAAADAHGLVGLLPDIRHLLADYFSNVLDDHVVAVDVLHGKEAPVVDGALLEAELLLPALELVELCQIAVAGACAINAARAKPPASCVLFDAHKFEPILPGTLCRL